MTKVGYNETNVEKYLSFNIRCTVCFSLCSHLLPQQKQTASWWLMFCTARNLKICSSMINLIQASFIIWMASEIVGHFSYPEQPYSFIDFLCINREVIMALSETTWHAWSASSRVSRDLYYIHIANKLIIYKIQLLYIIFCCLVIWVK